MTMEASLSVFFLMLNQIDTRTTPRMITAKPRTRIAFRKGLGHKEHSLFPILI